MLADVSIMPDMAVATDDGGALNHDPVLNHRAFADKYLLTDKGDAIATVMQTRTQVCFDIGFDFLQRLPRKLTSVEQRGVPRLVQVEQIAGCEHGATIREKSGRWKVEDGSWEMEDGKPISGWVNT